MPQKIIDETIELSQNSSKELQEHILSLIDLYNEQKKLNEKLSKENNFFLKTLDKRNTLIHSQDTKKDKLIEQQSRLAAMGEMIDSIAHQWRQPLNAISLAMEILQDDYNTKGSITKEHMQEANETVSLQIEHMISTLHEFRNFLRPSTKNENFSLSSVVENVQVLMKDELISQNINLTIEIDDTIKIHGNKNEFKHLFINLINNAIDAFNEKEIKKRDISIRCYKKANRIVIEIEDNAGGVPESVISTLFDANVTTKKNGKGTGIGLYMSAKIVKKNSGTIEVHNSDMGAFFTIVLQHATI